MSLKATTLARKGHFGKPHTLTIIKAIRNQNQIVINKHK
jgi:hypothetical protein